MRFARLPLLVTGVLGAWQVVEAGYNGTENSSVIIWPVSTDEQFSFVLTETLALASTAGSATSEVLRIASQIIPGNFSSWYDEFTWMADQMQQLANQARTETGRRESLFRASSYYRLAPYFLTGNASDPRLYTNWELAISNFHTAISLLPTCATNYTVEASNFSIPGYFFKPLGADNSTKLPTVIVGNGYDAPQEDTYHSLGQEALDRGWNFVTYEGPGQPTVRRRQKLGFIPDWWDVVSPVVDYLATRPDVDMNNVALVGISFGGLLAPLAATHENRLKAVLSIDGATDFQKTILTDYPSQLTQLFQSGNKTGFDQYIAYTNTLPTTPTSAKWLTGQGLWSFNTNSYYDWVSQLGAFTLTQDRIDNITAYPWVGQGQGDTTFSGLNQQLGEEQQLTGFYNQSGHHNATLKFFPNDLGAGQHCQLGAESQLAEAAFGWLSDVFRM